MNVTLITVNYFGAKDTFGLIDSINSSQPELEICVVDNSCDDLEWSELLLEREKRSHKNIIMLRSSENRGYMAGLNFGLSESSLQSEWYILCNNDLIFSHTFFDDLECVLTNLKEDIGLIAPGVVDSQSRRCLNPFLETRPDASKFRKLRFIYFNFSVFRFAHLCLNGIRRVTSGLRFFYRKSSSGEDFLPKQIYAAHGSIFIARADLCEGGFDSQYFMYGEEVSVAEKCRRSNIRVWFEPKLKLEHISHGSTGPVTSKKTFLRQKSAIQYVEETYFKN